MSIVTVLFIIAGVLFVGTAIYACVTLGDLPPVELTDEEQRQRDEEIMVCALAATIASM
jgi:hypothetical protein